MAPKKPELLELLRQSSKDSGNTASGSSSTPEPANPVHSQPETPSEPIRLAPRRPARRPTWLPAAGILVVVVPVLWILASWAFGDSEVLNASEEPKTETPADPISVEKDAEATTEPPATSPPVAVSKSFGVKVITYDSNDKNMQYAKTVGKALKANGLPNVQLLQMPGKKGSFLEVFVGKADSIQDLAKLRGRIRAYEYPVGSGQKPFASAGIFALPSTTSNN